MRALVSITGGLLATNAAFLGWAVWRTAALTAPLPAPPAPIAATDHSLTLAGMPGYTGTDPCDDLARFIAALNLTLVEVGVERVPMPDPLSEPVMQTSCRLDDPETARSLLIYRRTFNESGLLPPPAFAYFVVE